MEHLRNICQRLQLLRQGLHGILVIGSHLGCQVLLSLRDISSRSFQARVVDELFVDTFRDALSGTMPWRVATMLRYHVDMVVTSDTVFGVSGLEPTRVRWDDDSEIKCALKTVTRETDVQVCTDFTGRKQRSCGLYCRQVTTKPRPRGPLQGSPGREKVGS